MKHLDPLMFAPMFVRVPGSPDRWKKPLVADHRVVRESYAFFWVDIGRDMFGPDQPVLSEVRPSHGHGIDRDLVFLGDSFDVSIKP